MIVCEDPQSIEVPRGTDWSFQIQFPTADITDYTILLTVKKWPDEDPADTAAVIRTSGVVSGTSTVDFILTADDLSIPIGQYWWGLTFISIDGTVTVPTQQVDGVTVRALFPFEILGTAANRRSA